jgi:very-short-patch-repair endonuclease
MHVAVPANAARLRCPRRRKVRFTSSPERETVHVHWTRERHDRDTSVGTVPLLEALELVCLIEPEHHAIAALDWARRSGRLDEIALAELALRLPPGRRALVGASSTTCHSLPESLARSRLRDLGFRVREQVALPDNASPIDLLVEESIAVEVDGDEFHRDRFLPDRAKDLAATQAGYHALRPAARHVFHEWPAVLEAICAALSARGVQLPVVRAALPRASGVNNSGPLPRRRRLTRSNPRTSSPMPRRPRPMVLNC